MDTELGDKVGYAIRFEDKTSRNTIIKVTYFICLKKHPWSNVVMLCNRNLLFMIAIEITDSLELFFLVFARGINGV